MGRPFSVDMLDAAAGLPVRAKSTVEQAPRGTRDFGLADFPVARRHVRWDRRHVRWELAAVLAAAALLVLTAGCQELPTMGVMAGDPPAPSDTVAADSNQAASTQEAMLPTLKLNDDLYKTLKPSNRREWTPEQAQLARVDFHGNQATIHNIRNARWNAEDDVAVSYFDKTYDLNQLTSVDFIVVPFNDMPSLGHTMLSFGFDDTDYLAVSVEIRKERGEKFSAVSGFFQQYELIYVVADERDVIQKRVNCDMSDVFLYRSTATPKQARALFKDVMQRVNKLSREPEFYDTLTNNCTTNIRNHINRIKSEEIPYDYHVLLPGYSDRLAYDLGLVERHGSYDETRLRARVNYQACLYREDPEFSRLIRR